MDYVCGLDRLEGRDYSSTVGVDGRGRRRAISNRCEAQALRPATKAKSTFFAMPPQLKQRESSGRLMSK